MSLWFYEETDPFAFSLADELTEIKAELIRRGVDDDHCADVVDLAAVRKARADH